MKRSEISRLCKLGVKYVKVSAVDRFNVFSNLSGLFTRYENMFFLSSSGHDCKKKKKSEGAVSACVDYLKKIVDRLYILPEYAEKIDYVCNCFHVCYFRIWSLVWMSWIKHLLEDHLSSISTPTATGMIFVTVVYPVS